MLNETEPKGSELNKTFSSWMVLTQVLFYGSVSALRFWMQNQEVVSELSMLSGPMLPGCSVSVLDQFKSIKATNETLKLIKTHKRQNVETK